uniref:Tetratricopeptide repeat protein 39B n=1 Tax=Cyprinus carpio TaxID=7962 RepID=A0A8C1P617_CYPCA
MYHALGYSSILVMQATMTFEHKDIQAGMTTIKEALQTCQRCGSNTRRFPTRSASDLCPVCPQVQETKLGGGVHLHNICCVLQEFGLSQLQEGAGSHSLRSILCVLTLLFYHTYICLILGTGDGNLLEAEALLQPYIERFPRALVKFQECISAQQQWRQIHHLCYWELMWCHSFQQQWRDAYRYADLLCRESRWSKAIYVYQKAAILSMMSEEELKTTGENVVELFRQVEGLKQRLAGKSIPTEKFAIRKSRRYSSATPVKLVIPALEMMYVWNGFTIVGKRADTTESLLITIERAEEQLRNDPNPSEFHPDDQCLVQMLKGLCLKHLGRLLQAELCFTQVLSSEKRIRYDHYLIPFTLYELGLLYKQQGDCVKAMRFIEDAK